MDVLKESTLPPQEDGIVTAKVSSMAILGSSALLCCLLPLFLAKKLSTNGNWLNYLLRFGGGILLATTFLHLLPEVREGVEDVQEHVSWLKDSPIQVAELLMCIGFFIMYGVEEFAHKMLGHSHGPDSEKAVLHNEHHNPLYNKSDSTKLFTTLEEIQQEFLKLADDPYISGFESEDDVFNREKVLLWNRKNQEQTTDKYNLTNIKDKYDWREKSKRECGDLHRVWSESTPLRAILITVAISIHQLFEGLAVGLETHTSQVWILTGAITAHKVVIALCVGAEVAKAKASAAAVLIAVFTLATPLGISMGLALSEGVTMGLVSVILQGLACGTLLYVVFFEVLSKQEGAPPDLVHFAITAFGFAVMLILLYFFES